MRRWTQKDPIRLGGGQESIYVYAGDDPINGIDQSGLDGWWGGPPVTCSMCAEECVNEAVACIALEPAIGPGGFAICMIQ